jgi:proline dehydrogenase
MISQTAILPNAQSLINLSAHLTNTRALLEPPVLFPGTPSPSDLSILHSSTSTGALTESDIRDLKELYNDLVLICTRAEERGVRVFIDAEHRCVSSLSAACQILQPELSLHIIVGTNPPSTHLETR